MIEPALILKPGREKSILRRHPWIFSGAVARVDDGLEPGQTVCVRAAGGKFLCRAAYSPKSQIAGRIWTWDEAESVEAAFLRRRLLKSIAARAGLGRQTNALRLVNAESDGLPGLIVDRYGDFIVCQLLSTGPEHWKSNLADLLSDLAGVAGVYERSDVDVRSKEGLQARSGVLRGESPPEVVEIWERLPGCPEMRFLVDIANGHKTGFYLDQRDNRKVVADFARRQNTLNLFAYTGSFTVSALLGEASAVTSIDSSGPALGLARRNLELNNLPSEGIVETDAFTALRQFRDQGAKFDLIILDPPKFVQSEAQVNRASRAYKDINWLAMRLLNAGGHLITFSCSGLVTEDLFQKILFGAALDAGRDVQIVMRLGQAGDHPVLLTFPEGAYLKGFVCRVS